jgi:hypothetical protein
MAPFRKKSPPFTQSCPLLAAEPTPAGRGPVIAENNGTAPDAAMKRRWNEQVGQPTLEVLNVPPKAPL